MKIKSCLTNLTDSHNEIITSLDDEKARDAVSLMEYRPDKCKVKWSENCPKCQAQRVVINDTQSRVTRAVLQESVLSCSKSLSMTWMMRLDAPSASLQVIKKYL